MVTFGEWDGMIKHFHFSFYVFLQCLNCYNEHILLLKLKTVCESVYIHIPTQFASMILGCSYYILSYTQRHTRLFTIPTTPIQTQTTHGHNSQFSQCFIDHLTRITLLHINNTRSFLIIIVYILIIIAIRKKKKEGRKKGVGRGRKEDGKRERMVWAEQ